jgi:hypothetical protein
MDKRFSGMHTGIARKRSQQGDTKLQTEDMMMQ